ncbi:MAG: low-complexity protein [Gammaproteobacteria bacterium]|nr:low-complexity protein [Gammaproteobacteria bacterium]
MAKKTTLKPITLAVGAALASSMVSISVANATANPFGMTTLSSGYMSADCMCEGKCGEGKCGGDKDKEGKCGEGKCGGDK